MITIPRISICQMVGRYKGQTVLVPTDKVIAHTDNGDLKIGYIHHEDNAIIRFTRFVRPELREEIRARAAELRRQINGHSMGERISCVPDPRLIAAYLQGKKVRKKPSPKTTMIMPDGIPSGGKE